MVLKTTTVNSPILTTASQVPHPNSATPAEICSLATQIQHSHKIVTADDTSVDRHSGDSNPGVSSVDSNSSVNSHSSAGVTNQDTVVNNSVTNETTVTVKVDHNISAGHDSVSVTDKIGHNSNIPKTGLLRAGHQTGSTSEDRQDLEAARTKGTQHLSGDNDSKVVRGHLTESQGADPEIEKSQCNVNIESNSLPDISNKLSAELEDRKLILKHLDIGTQNCKIDVSHIIQKDFLLLAGQRGAPPGFEPRTSGDEVDQNITQLGPKHRSIPQLVTQ